ncbi:MAG: tetraacyldisaccharide 4'-kinase [Phycisphaerae bacterium]|nr:tetraacyldisaccharide 4'-kinase [Phycisphaerae bacterium]
MASLRSGYLDLVEGRRVGAVADLSRAALSLLSMGYLGAVGLRNLYYGAVPRTVRRAECSVISVGNITTGGTGKTPLVAYIARRLVDHGRRPGILTRGYRGRPVEYSDDRRQEAAGRWRVESDEAMVLQRLSPEAIIVVDANRIAGAQEATRRGADVLVLDDGFQHRRLARDLDIVLIDAVCPFGHGHLLPRGLLREPAGAVRRADLIVVTHSDEIADADRARLVDLLRRLSGDKPVLQSRHRVHRFVDLKGRPVEPIDVRAMRALVFAGIGRFDSFRSSLTHLGVDMAAAYDYPDHHDYSRDEMAQLLDVATQLEANAVVTTEKDAVKLVGRWPESPLPLLVARLTVEFDDAHGKMLDDAVRRAAAAPPRGRPSAER